MSKAYDFIEIKQLANGMLAPEVYEKIFQYASMAQPGLFIEIGTAHGAATIAMGLAAKEKKSQIYTFEKIVGGSRERYGNFEKNLEIIRDNFEKFNLSDCIHLMVGEVEELRAKVDLTRPVSMLMIDADGAIDRDIEFFYDALLPGAPIIIDDCVDKARLKYMGRGNYQIDLKHRLTYRLVELFIENGVVVQDEIVNGTFFGHKPENSPPSNVFEKLPVKSIYRSLVHTDAKLANSFIKNVRNRLAEIRLIRNIKCYMDRIFHC